MSTAEEQALIERVDAADAAELAEVLSRPGADEDRVLRAYLGDQRYERQRELMLRRSIRRAATRKPAGNVVVLHGIMGSQLSSVNRSGAPEPVWLKVLKIPAGELDRLRDVVREWVVDQDALDRKRNHFLKAFRGRHGFDRTRYTSEQSAEFEGGLTRINTEEDEARKAAARSVIDQAR